MSHSVFSSPALPDSVETPANFCVPVNSSVELGLVILIEGPELSTKKVGEAVARRSEVSLTSTVPLIESVLQSETSISPVVQT